MDACMVLFSVTKLFVNTSNEFRRNKIVYRILEFGMLLLLNYHVLSLLIWISLLSTHWTHWRQGVLKFICSVCFAKIVKVKTAKCGKCHSHFCSHRQTPSHSIIYFEYLLSTLLHIFPNCFFYIVFQYISCLCVSVAVSFTSVARSQILSVWSVLYRRSTLVFMCRKYVFIFNLNYTKR